MHNLYKHVSVHEEGSSLVESALSGAMIELAYYIRLFSFARADLKKNDQFRVRAIQMARAQFQAFARQLGIRVVGEYVTAEYDLITIMETTDLNAIVRISEMTGSIKGITKVETLEAFPAQDLEKTPAIGV